MAYFIKVQWKTMQELRYYKNDWLAWKKLFVLKLARFLLTVQISEKARQFQNKQISSGIPVVLILS